MKKVSDDQLQSKRPRKECDHQWVNYSTKPDVENSPKDKGGIRHEWRCKKCGALRTTWGSIYD